MRLTLDKHDVKDLLGLWADLRQQRDRAQEQLGVVSMGEAAGRQLHVELTEARAHIEVLEAELARVNPAINAQEVLDGLVKPVRALCQLLSEESVAQHRSQLSLLRALVKDMANALGEDDRVTW